MANDTKKSGNQITDADIRSWIKQGETFEGRSVGDGLYLRLRGAEVTPVWRFRYRFGGKPRVIVIGNYQNLSLADARKEAKRLSARVVLGYDVAGEKQERKRMALEEIEAKENAYTFARLADEFFEKRVLGAWKHPNIVRARIEKDIKPAIGHLRVDAVTPRHIDELLQSVVKRGAPTMANDVLRWVKRIFNHAIKMHITTINPALAFDLADAGGKEQARKRKLSRDEIVKLFAAMGTAKGFSVENELSIKLLLALAVRKGELIGARWDEFDLDDGVWHLPAERTKTNAAISIPLSKVVVDWFRELKKLSCSSDWVLPARKMQDRMIPHISESTLSVALAKVKHELEPFTIHDLRRTAKTLLASLGVKPHISERCLNHKIKGVEGIYDGYDYFEERKDALNALSNLLVQLELGEVVKVIPINYKATA
jgi:integrase